jgi:hypothetical protein
VDLGRSQAYTSPGGGVRGANPAGVDVRPAAGGWAAVLDLYERQFAPHLRKYPAAHVVLLLDFDDRGDERRAECEGRIPDDLKPRTFLLRARSTPEQLKRELNLTLEQIGFALADECSKQHLALWGHAHLAHNSPELTRLMPVLHPILFGA